jgi:hypothetical protein
MFAGQTIASWKPKDEAAKPFWISFADLMTALTILFLVIMCVALLAVTRTISEAEKAGDEREKEINRLLEMLAENVRKCRHAEVLKDRRVIDFGSQATFTSDDHHLSASQIHNLRECVPEILAIAANELGKKDFVLEAVQRFYKSSTVSRLRDAQLVCYGLIEPFGRDKRSLMDDEQRFCQQRSDFALKLPV